MIDLIFTIFKIYAPLLFGITYVLGFERKKLDNLLKFLVLNTHIILFQQLIQSSFEMKNTQIFLIPFYLYLTLFNYAYSGVLYDVVCGPLFGILLQVFEGMKIRVEKERVKAQVYNDNGEQKIGFITRVQRLIVDTFKNENILLLA